MNDIKKQLELIRNYPKKKKNPIGTMNLEMFEETDIYTESGVQEYSENDAISITEQGFMVGYLAS